MCTGVMSVFLGCWRFFFFFKQKTAYEMRISDWSSDVCSSDLVPNHHSAWGFPDSFLLQQYPYQGDPAEALVGSWTDKPEVLHDPGACPCYVLFTLKPIECHPTFMRSAL